MVFGIGLIAMVTSSLVTYFLNHKPRVTDDKNSNATVEHIKSQLDDYENLSSHEFDRLLLLMKSLKKEKK